MTIQLRIDNVSVTFGKRRVLDDVSFTLGAGEFGCLLGPSGCGKTTLLRAIAGFETLTGGSIQLHDKTLCTVGFHLPPEQRRVGMVFQDFALFPHLSVADNIGFGLHKLPALQRQQRVRELLDLIDLSELGTRFPHQLSGGQQQRVALARAIAPKPELLLLDEPFSSLDVELRTQLAQEVREMLKRDGVTALLVTHDQQEAFAFADRIGVLSEGCLHQWDTPYAIYHRPVTHFVAEFIGQGSLISARVQDGLLQSSLGVLGQMQTQTQTQTEPAALQVLLRPDDLVLSPESTVRLRVLQRSFRGAEYLYTLITAKGERVYCLTPSHIEFAPGEYLPVKLDIQHLVIFAEA